MQVTLGAHTCSSHLRLQIDDPRLQPRLVLLDRLHTQQHLGCKHLHV